MKNKLLEALMRLRPVTPVEIQSARAKARKTNRGVMAYATDVIRKKSEAQSPMKEPDPPADK